MNPLIELLPWESARTLVAPVRFRVFVQEQNVPAEIEIDAMDPLCVHALARGVDGRVIGTGRLLPSTTEQGRATAHIGRMAVLAEHRGQGVGAQLLSALSDAARQRGDLQVALSAQVHALAFYLRFGFLPEGPEYMDAGISHRAMRKAL